MNAGVFAEIFRLSAQAYQELEGMEWTWQAVDGGFVPAPVRGQAVCLEEEALGRNPTDRGRSGSTTSLPVDQNGIPLGLTLVGAKVHDSRRVSSTVAADVLSRPQPTPAQPQHLCLDKGYEDPRVEKELEDQSYIPHIRRIGEEKIADGDKTYPARRWVVERTLAWLKGFRAIRPRYFCQARNYLAMLHLACAFIISRKLTAA